MEAISLGSGPESYSLRIYCEVGPQFQFDGAPQNLALPHSDVTCTARFVDGRLLLSAKGFATRATAVSFFHQLQAHLVNISVRQRIALTIPDVLREAYLAPFQLSEGAAFAKASSWPTSSIQPKLINSTGAWVYAEQDFVLLTPIYSVRPTFSLSLNDVVGALEESWASTSFPISPQPLLMLAAANYAHASRSTQWVWSFMLAVMTLDMLAAGARGRKKDAVVMLVQRYCAPGVSAKPRPDLFADANDCKSKVTGIYDLRSQYVHEGHVPADSQELPSFAGAHRTALQSLAHIIHERLAE